VCTIKHARSTVICDVAIGRVRQECASAFAGGVTHMVVAGRGPSVEAVPTVDAQ
jgi:hypothetical protein